MQCLKIRIVNTIVHSNLSIFGKLTWNDKHLSSESWVCKLGKKYRVTQINVKNFFTIRKISVFLESSTSFISEWIPFWALLSGSFRGKMICEGGRGRVTTAQKMRIYSAWYDSFETSILKQLQRWRIKTKSTEKWLKVVKIAIIVRHKI